MLIIILSRLFTFMSNVAINKKNRLLFHRYDMISLVLFFIAIACWLDPSLREYFNWLQIDLLWYETFGVGIAFLPVIVTLFHVVADSKKKGTIWYFGDGYGNIFEDTVRILAKTDYKGNKKKYIRTSVILRIAIFIIGIIVISTKYLL